MPRKTCQNHQLWISFQKKSHTKLPSTVFEHKSIPLCATYWHGNWHVANHLIAPTVAVGTHSQQKPLNKSSNYWSNNCCLVPETPCEEVFRIPKTYLKHQTSGGMAGRLGCWNMKLPFLGAKLAYLQGSNLLLGFRKGMNEYSKTLLHTWKLTAGFKEYMLFSYENTCFSPV